MGGGNQGNNNMAGIGMNQMNAFQMGLMNQNQGMGGVGGGATGGFNHMAAPQALTNNNTNNEMSLMNRKGSAGSGDSGLDSASVGSVGAASQTSTAKTPEERAALLQQLKDDIAKRERDMAELEASLAAGTGGRGEAAQEKVDDDEVDSSLRDAKRVKKEEGDKDAELAAV
jgi:hypothetical protein